MIGRRSMAIALFVGLTVWARATPPGSELEVFEDPRGDAYIRRTDPGANAPFDPAAHRLIDLIEIRLGEWIPVDPALDLFTGEFESDDSVMEAEFVRLDLLGD